MVARETVAHRITPFTGNHQAYSGNELVCMVWNDHSGRHPFPEKRRTPLCVAVSHDDCATWSPSEVIESDPNGWYCYTSISFDKGNMIISYCAGDSVVGGLNRLKMTRLPVPTFPEMQ